MLALCVKNFYFFFIVLKYYNYFIIVASFYTFFYAYKSEVITISDGRIIISTEIDNTGAEKGISGLGNKLGSRAKTGLKAFMGLMAGTSVRYTRNYNSEMEQYMSSFTTILEVSRKLLFI